MRGDSAASMTPTGSRIPFADVAVAFDPLPLALDAAAVDPLPLLADPLMLLPLVADPLPLAEA